MAEPKGIAVAEALDLHHDLDYSTGCIVSKTIIDKDTGTVTFFAFDQGQNLSEHTAPYDALLHVLDGRALILIAGKEHPLAAGQMIVMPANVPHAVRGVERFKMLLTMIRA